MNQCHRLIAVIGPTASGKTSFAAHLAAILKGEIISADSRQVYKGMTVGTGKDYDDYTVKDQRIPYHLIDIAEPGYKYSIYEYQRDFINVFKNIMERGRVPILCGGSGLYLDAVTRHYRLEKVPVNEELRQKLSAYSLNELASMLSHMKKLHNITDTDTIEHALRAIEIEHYRMVHPDPVTDFPDFKVLYLGVMYDRETERARITDRLESRLSGGLIEEVKHLLDSGIPEDTLMYYGLEYRFVTLFLTNKMDYQTMKNGLNTAIHQFAKRQRTWFRKMEKEGCQINWLSGELTLEEKLQKALEIIQSH